ncbi:MAG: phosphomannomutase/phosphoglucomutase [Proteobacteria bacterium]|nr:phosphomannomutase/phosphoglucomutase [Pseudomonadota bacterium]
MAIPKSSLVSFGMIPVAGTVVGFLAAVALTLFMVQAIVNNSHRNMLADELSTEIANQINIRSAIIGEQMLKLSESSIVRDAVIGTNAEIVEAEAVVSTMLPHAQRVRIFPIDTAKPDQGFPPFNYVALDVVNLAEQGAPPPLEAISAQGNFQGQKWVIAAQPVIFRDGTVKGTLFAYFNPSALLQGVTDGNKGEVSILQRVGTENRPVTSIGSGNGPVVTKKLDAQKWSFQYRPNEKIAGSTSGNIILLLVPSLVMLLVAVAACLAGAKQTARLIATNVDMTVSLVQKLATTGNADREGDFTLDGFDEIGANLKALQNMKPAQSRDVSPAPAVKAAKPVPKADSEIVDIEMTDDDLESVEEFEVDDFDEVIEQARKPDKPKAANLVSQGIFRAYDIRGVVGQTLSEDVARQVGLAVGSEAEARGQQAIIVGYDGREYSPALAEALIEGLTASGRDVINIGAVPTPLVYYGTHNSSTTSGIMVTGSHNPPDYNGFKIVLAGRTLVGDEIQALYKRITEEDYTSGEGTVSEIDLKQDYIDAIADDVVVAQPLKVVLDCGNGIAGSIIPELIDALGCEAVPLYCEVDGSFPNHHPDPTKPENLEDLILTVKSQGADLGIGFDGDGDRLVAVTADGDIVWPDQLLMLFAKDVVSRNPGSDVVYDVKCTRHLNSVISGFGGRPIICRTGHSYLKEKIIETGALLGGEMSGHICFAERWFGFDDGLYSAARLLEIVGSQEEGLAELLKEFPVSVSTPEIHVAVPDDEKFDLIDKLISAADFEDATIQTIDGLRVDFPDGWGLVRASNTEPAITLRFEADTEEALEDIKAAFREMIQEIREDLDFA